MDNLTFFTGIYVPNGFDACEVCNLKATVILQIGCHHPKEKITVARHELALDHLRHCADFLDELIYGFLVLPGQLHAGEHSKT